MNDRRQLHNKLLETVAVLLYHHNRPEPQNISFEEMAEQWGTGGEFPRAVRERFLNDAKFHNQVQRAVAALWQVLDKYGLPQEEKP